jgi:hypothetical protein
MQALVAAPAAAPVLLAQQAPPAVPELKFAGPDVAAETVLHFFDARQFATLRRLSQILEPAAGDCGAPEFLDFLLNASPRERQQMYQKGLDMLERDAQSRFRKSFGETDDAQATQLIAGLRKPWTYQAPDVLTAFLREAKDDIHSAAVNSEAWAKAGRPGAGGGQYWLPVE